MGLDVYLRKYENYSDAKRREEEYERRSSEIWAKYGSYDSLSEDQKEEVRTQTKAIAAELNLNEYGSARDETTIENNSRLYPEHLFKVGYFRSSYNEGGFNRVMPPICGIGLDDIFPEHESEYEFQPDWKAARERAIIALEKARQHIEQNGAHRITTLDCNMFTDPSEFPNSQELAMKIFDAEFARYRENKEKHPDSFAAYSNAKGSFYFGEPLHVLAAVSGRGPFGKPCIYAVFKDDENLKWYLQALEIVIETCEFVLDQPDKEKHYLAWSS